jgi:RNA polymerase sigma factor (sigma-70 family)
MTQDNAEEGSVTCYIHDLIGGGKTDHAAEALWVRYYDRLVKLARKHLRLGARVIADEEDAALSAFDSFCRAAAAGRFPRLGGRDALWRLLVTITARKVCDQIVYETAQMRDVRRTWNETELAAAHPSDGSRVGLEQIIGREPRPEFAAILAEQFQARLDRLNNSQREIALLKMEGYGNTEIAERLSCSVSTVERKLNLTRKIWESQETARDERRKYKQPRHSASDGD